jgi:hypothetical protein
MPYLETLLHSLGITGDLELLESAISQTIGDPPADTSFERASDERFQTFNKLWTSNLHLVIFRASSGGIGLSLNCIKPGDGIYLVAGGFVPFIFRGTDINSQGGYNLELVSDALIHGIMFGEGLKGNDLEFKPLSVY